MNCPNQVCGVLLMAVLSVFLGALPKMAGAVRWCGVGVNMVFDSVDKDRFNSNL
ncbi:hypothetical protein FQZ97_875100 [compost metagenome]